LNLLKTEIYDLFIISFQRFNKKIKRQIFSETSHGLYREYEKYTMFKSELEDNETKVLDEVFILYIEHIRKTIKNKQQIRQNLRFLLLFREFLNIEFEKLYNLNKRIEFTATQFTNDLPNYTNIYLDHYLDICKNTFEIGVNEGILLASNLCNWLFENKYTKIKLLKNQME